MSQTTPERPSTTLSAIRPGGLPVREGTVGTAVAGTPGVTGTGVTDQPASAQSAQLVPVVQPPPIATLPPLVPESATGYPTSERTGEPRRPLVVWVIMALCWLSVAVTIVAFARWWHMAAMITTLFDSARVFGWAQPNPVSFGAIALVIVVAIIGVLMVAAAGAVAYNTWTGQPWVRWAGLIAVGVLGLSFLLNWWFSAALAPVAVAAGLLWLPAVRRFCTAMAGFHAVKPVVPRTSDIRYGPQPLIGGRG